LYIGLSFCQQLSNLLSNGSKVSQRARYIESFITLMCDFLNIYCSCCSWFKCWSI